MLNKRDLKADLEAIRDGTVLFKDLDPNSEIQYELYEVAEHAIERALKAEAIVRKYEETEFTPEEEVNDMVRRFTSFLCEMTGGLMSNPNYTLKDMIAVADDYQQTICDESLQEEVKRANEAEALVRELVGALDIGLYGSGNRSLEERGLVLRRSYDKAKEVLGDGNNQRQGG